jgi:hypothetical protein
MAKRIKQYSEAELIKMFGLERLLGNTAHPLMQEWTDTQTTLNEHEKYLFDIIIKDAFLNIAGWNEESLKMNFISFVLKLGHIANSSNYKTYFEETIEATIEGHFLKIKTDFMLAKGILDMPESPYFHFQEYKKDKDPSGDPDAQLLEALLIAQEKNRTTTGQDIPIYGCSIKGRRWEFFVLHKKTYCISKVYECTEEEDLLQIIAILRKFKEILETRLL